MDYEMASVFRRADIRREAEYRREARRERGLRKQRQSLHRWAMTLQKLLGLLIICFAVRFYASAWAVDAMTGAVDGAVALLAVPVGIYLMVARNLVWKSWALEK